MLRRNILHYIIIHAALADGLINACATYVDMLVLEFW
jgi:hypothetical protein